MSHSEPVVMTEYQTEDVDLDDDDVRLLRGLVGDRLTVARRDFGGWAVTATSYVGTVVTPKLRLLVLPKVKAANLFHLLEPATDRIHFGMADFDYARQRDLLPAFAAFYARALERTIARGLHRGYVEERDRLVALRGRIDIPAQRRSAGLPLPVACAFDEHTADQPVNRVVRSAAERLLLMPGVVPATRRTLGALIGRLAEASPLRPDDLARCQHLNRLNEHYRPVIGLARLVLAGASILNGGHGSSAAGSFLVNMNDVFERFVEDRLRAYLRGRLDVAGQDPSSLGVDGAVSMRPDLVFRSDGRVVFVGDAKYKVTSDGRGKNDDYYQLLAYTTAHAVRGGVLVYCHHGGAAPVDVRVRHVGTALRTWPVRLDGGPPEIEEQMRRLADEVHAWSAGRQPVC